MIRWQSKIQSCVCLTRKPFSDSPHLTFIYNHSQLVFTSNFLILPSLYFYVTYCLQFRPWGMGARGRKGTISLLAICIPVPLSHTQDHLSLNHRQARTFQCHDLPQNKDFVPSRKLRSDCPS